MEYAAFLIDFILHVDRYLEVFVRDHGPWVYALLFLIVFVETGLVVMPFLPGDSLLFVVGALCGVGFMSLPVAMGVPIVAAISLNNAGHPIYTKITQVSGFNSEALAKWASQHLAPGCAVLSDGLACFRSVTTPGCRHEAVVSRGRHPKDLSEFRWINILLGNLKTSISGSLHAFNFDKYAQRYLGGYCSRFNRRFEMKEMTDRIANAVCCCKPCPERALRVAEVYG